MVVVTLFQKKLILITTSDKQNNVKKETCETVINELDGSITGSFDIPERHFDGAHGSLIATIVWTMSFIDDCIGFLHPKIKHTCDKERLPM